MSLKEGQYRIVKELEESKFEVTWMVLYLVLLIQLLSVGCKKSSTDLESLTKSSSYIVGIDQPEADFYTSRYGFDPGFDPQSRPETDAFNGSLKFDSISPIIEGEIEDKIRKKDSHCKVPQGKYSLDSRPLVFAEFYMVRFIQAPSGCRLREGYFRRVDVRVGNKNDREFMEALDHKAGEAGGIIKIGSKTACEYSWEEKPGTTDYTVFDSYTNRNYPSADRNQAETLQGVQDPRIPRILRAGNSIDVMCHNGKILKSCFARGLERVAKDPIGRIFTDWATKYSIDPVRFRMAIAMKETNLGGLRDDCSNLCNGIGMNQVITIVTDSDQETNSPNRPEWSGITHNILTNMKYGARVLAKKIQYNQPTNIRSLASAYNGSNTRYQYAIDVEKYYLQLKSSCDL